MLKIDRLDHVVLTVQSISTTIHFYERLGFEHVVNGDRHALHFGESKINLHRAEHPFQPAAAHPSVGSGDLCFITDTPARAVAAELEAKGISIVKGPVQRTGALGPITSVYVRDPDGNLLEFAT